MYNGPNKPPISSSKLVILMLVSIVLVMLATVALNGGTSTPPVEKTDNVSSEQNNSSLATTDSAIIGNNSYGTVVKSSGYGNPASDIHIAFIVGVDAKKSQNSIVPTIQGDNELNYCYDIYLVDTSSANNSNNQDNQNNMTINEMSESLAAEYVVPDVIRNNYNFTVDVHSTNDSNSYVFVPSDNTYTSKKVLESIVNNTNLGSYTPEKHSYTELISENIIDYEIPSIVYVTKDYYSNGTSGEVKSVIHAIDNFDFVGLFNSEGNSTNDTNYTNVTDNNVSDYSVVNVSNNSTGNKEVN